MKFPTLSGIADATDAEFLGVTVEADSGRLDIFTFY